MENVIFKFSDFLLDDGAFEAAERKIQQFGDRIVESAKRTKAEFAKALNLDDIEGVSKFEEQIESLTDQFKENQKAQEDLNKIKIAAEKINKQGLKTQEQQVQRLADLDKELATYRSDLKEVNTLSRNNIKTDRDLNKERVQAQLNIKRVSTQIRGLQKEILNRNKLSRDQEKLLRAQITLEKEQVNTLGDVRERIAALRVVVQSLDFREEAEKIAEYNAEIDELTGLLSDNSDQFIQNKINIGNYEESITNALRSTNLFSTGIGFLDNAIGSLVQALTLTGKELKELEESLKENSTALRRLTVSFGRLNRTLKASIIGVVIVALSALSSAFGDTRAGSIRLQKVLQTLTTTFIAFAQGARTLFTAIGSSIVAFFSNPLTGPGRAVAIMRQAFKEIGETVKSGGEAVVAGLANIERAFRIEDSVRRLTQEIAKLEGQLALLQSAADDSTQSLTSQLEANEKALNVSERIARRNVTIAQQRLELANERVKQNILANTVEASNIDLTQTGVGFAQATLNLAQKRGASLEISNSLLEEQQNAVIEVTKAENEQELNREENNKKRREIQRDLFEQNLDLLIDLIDTEKTLSEAFVNDTTQNFRARVNEFNRFLVRFRQNAQRELDEFTQQAQRRGLDLDFEVQFDEDGNFELFIGDTRLATDNIIELNKQLQATGLSEIEINRFREFIIETRNGVKDFRALNAQLVQVGINLRNINDNLISTEGEIIALRMLDAEILKLRMSLGAGLTIEQRRQILKQLEELEKRRLAIIEFGSKEVITARIVAIDEQLAVVAKGSEDERKLLLEKAKLERQLVNMSAQEQIKTETEKQKRIIEEQRKAAKQIRSIIQLVLDAVLKAQDRQVQAAQEASNKQAEAVDRQQERARQGLSNTLAFEQRALAQREAERIREERRRERLQKIRALYSSYNNYANQGDGENALAKALRDFAILEAISATFADGGIVGVDGFQKVRTNSKGITMGRSHNMKGGIPALHERGEGFFSKQEVSNMGEDNFRIIKDMAGKGQIDSDFFKGQRKEFATAVAPITVRNDDRLISEMRGVKRSIENKPVQNWDFAEFTHDTVKMIETVATKNHTKRNTHIIKRPRL